MRISAAKAVVTTLPDTPAGKGDAKAEGKGDAKGDAKAAPAAKAPAAKSAKK